MKSNNKFRKKRNTFQVQNHHKQETNTKENFDVPLNIFTEVYGRDFNATFESIAKVMHKSEVDSENYSSNEELENNEMGSDVDSEASDAEKSHLIRLNNDRPVVTIKSLENFLNEKLSDIKIHKEMQHSRLEKIISLQRDSKIILESLHKQANQNLE